MFCVIATRLLCNSMLNVVSFYICMLCKYLYDKIEEMPVHFQQVEEWLIIDYKKDKIPEDVCHLLTHIDECIRNLFYLPSPKRNSQGVNP